MEFVWGYFIVGTNSGILHFFLYRFGGMLLCLAIGWFTSVARSIHLICLHAFMIEFISRFSFVCGEKNVFNSIDERCVLSALSRNAKKDANWNEARNENCIHRKFHVISVPLRTRTRQRSDQLVAATAGTQTDQCQRDCVFFFLLLSNWNWLKCPLELPSSPAATLHLVAH